MAPEIYRNQQLVIDAPDQSGVYDTPLGAVRIDSSRIHPSRNSKIIVIQGEFLQNGRNPNGRRKIEISNKKDPNLSWGLKRSLF